MGPESISLQDGGKVGRLQRVKWFKRGGSQRQILTPSLLCCRHTSCPFPLSLSRFAFSISRGNPSLLISLFAFPCQFQYAGSGSDNDQLTSRDPIWECIASFLQQDQIALLVLL